MPGGVRGRERGVSLSYSIQAVRPEITQKNGKGMKGRHKQETHFHMAQSLADIVLHIVFSTKERKPWIDTVTEPELYAYICGICRNLGCPVIKINGVEDHVHLLLSLGRTTAVSKLIAEIKSNSSRWIKAKDRQFCEFSWQGGYGAFSVSRPQINGVVKYIEMQKEHHKTQTFQEEFLTMLKLGQIQYDEKYLWD